MTSAEAYERYGSNVYSAPVADDEPGLEWAESSHWERP